MFNRVLEIRNRGMRGENLASIARRTGAYDAATGDSDLTVLQKFANWAIRANPNFKGNKGDPGGNVMSIGMFSVASTLTIPIGTDAVYTSGYAMVGIGAARYVSDAVVNSVYVTANSRSSFISQNGRGFRLDLSGTITPAMFGAKGDGLADDTIPLRYFIKSFAAIHALEANAVYSIKPDTDDSLDIILPLDRAITLEGNDASIFIADGTSGYSAIIGAFGNKDLTGLVIRNVIFDHNIMNEQIVKVGNSDYPVGSPQNRFGGSVLQNARHTVLVKKASSFVFRGNTVKNVASTNCIVYSGDGFTRLCDISFNKFINVGDTPNHIYHDHSTLYPTGDNQFIFGNYFEGAQRKDTGFDDAFCSPGVNCAIETHPGFGAIITGNRCVKYHTFINYAGVYETDSRDGTVTGNSCEVLRAGIILYSSGLPGGVHDDPSIDFGIDGLTIDSNIIRIRNSLPRKGMDGGGDAIGIGGNKSFSLPVRGISIGASNRIRFDYETSAPDYDGVPIGVGFPETTSNVTYEDISIGAMEIVNCPGIGAMFGQGAGKFVNLNIGALSIIRPGSTQKSGYPDTNRAGIAFNANQFIGLRVERAIVSDDKNANRLHNAIIIGSDAVSSEVVIKASIRLKSKTNWNSSFLKLNNNVVPFIDIEQNGQPDIGPQNATSPFAASTYVKGSVAIDTMNGNIFRNTQPNGYSFVLEN